MKLPRPRHFALAHSIPRRALHSLRTSLGLLLLVVSTQLFAVDINALKASPDFQQLEIKASTKKIRVIVESKLDNAQASLFNKRVKGRDALKAFARLAGLQEDKVLDDLPLMVYEVDADQLELLTNSGLIENIVEDRLNRPNLVQSMAQISGSVAHNFNMKGNTAAVAILDSGVSKDHPMLTGRVIAEACYSTKSVIQGASSVCPNGTTSQTGSGAGVPCGVTGCWHGTHVASIAAGAQASSYGPGVAPQATIIAVQVMTKLTGESNCGTGVTECVAAYDSDIVKGLNYVNSIAVANKVAAVNLSLGGGKYTSTCNTSTIKTPIDNLRTNGVVTVISSGNDGYSDGISSPGCISTALTVGSTKDNSDSISSYSNGASILDMLAPGESITAAYYTAASGNSYATASGTSMAAPHVAGAIALLKGYNNSYTAQQMEDLVKQNAVTVTDSRNGFSFPRLDIGKMTQAAAGPSHTPTITINTPANNAVVNRANVVLSATAMDNQDGNISANVTWKSNIAGVITSPAALAAGTHIITATILDSNKFTNSASITINASNAPTVNITAPSANITINLGQSITLTGTASDTESGNLSSTIQWSSNLSGNLGSGSSITKTLALGTHIITATVTDGSGLTPTLPATRTVTVSCSDCDGDGMPDAWEAQYNLTNPAGDEDGDTLSNVVEYQHGSNPRDAAPQISIVSPGTMLVSERPATLSAQATDQEDGNLSNAVHWSSNTEGNLGSGNNLSHSFAIGTHILSATVTDSKGATPVNPATRTVHVSRLGDINDDELINSMDLLLLQQHIAGTRTLSAEELLRGDLYPAAQGNGNITVQDLLLLEKKLVE